MKQVRPAIGDDSQDESAFGCLRLPKALTSLVQGLERKSTPDEAKTPAQKSDREPSAASTPYWTARDGFRGEDGAEDVKSSPSQSEFDDPRRRLVFSQHAADSPVLATLSGAGLSPPTACMVPSISQPPTSTAPLRRPLAALVPAPIPPPPPPPTRPTGTPLPPPPPAIPKPYPPAPPPTCPPKIGFGKLGTPLRKGPGAPALHSGHAMKPLHWQQVRVPSENSVWRVAQSRYSFQA